MEMPGKVPLPTSWASSVSSHQKTAALVHRPERRMIATDTLVVQNNRRRVICFVCISHQQIGQIVENEPLFVIVDRGDHMIKIVASIVHGHEPNVVCGESSRASRRILSDGMRLAIAISHRDHDPPPLKWSDLRYVFDIKEDCNDKEAIQA